jgi:FixJ family two-component response regulator
MHPASAPQGVADVRSPTNIVSDVRPLVFVVDDDDGMRAAVLRVLGRAGIDGRGYGGGSDLLALASLDPASCIVLDVAMPRMDGLAVQAALKARGAAAPVVFLTGSADIPVAVAAMREGAVDFIEKPFDNADLVARVRSAIEHHARQRLHDAGLADAQARFRQLTAREREVCQRIAAGKTSKEVARELGVSHRTVEIHRARVMEKMGAPTLADLVRKQLLVEAAAGTH